MRTGAGACKPETTEREWGSKMNGSRAGPFARPRDSSHSSPCIPMEASESKNVLGGPLRTCSDDPTTGFYRTGRCETGPRDTGQHVVCAEMTAEFLEYTKAQGNDLSTPRPQWNFPGLEPGDRWCLCAARWQEALEADVAPPVLLEATHQKALQLLALDDLKAHALDPSAS